MSASDVVALTPDGDLYVEDYGDGSPDLESVRYGSFQDPPLGVPRHQVYRFRQPPTSAEPTELEAEVAVLAEQECRRRALGVGNPALLAGLICLVPLISAPAAVSRKSAVPSQGILRGTAAAVAEDDLAGHWRAAMGHGRIRYGDVIAGHVRSTRAVGNRDIHEVGGEGIFVEYI